MNRDTICLLKECNAGCKTATNCIGQVISHVHDGDFKDKLRAYNQVHVRLGDRCHALLNRCQRDEKDPSPMAKIMTNMNTNMKLMMDGSQEKVADLMADGCAMGIKSLRKYLNQYPNAESEVTKIAWEIIEEEKKFLELMYPYL